MTGRMGGERGDAAPTTGKNEGRVVHSFLGGACHLRSQREGRCHSGRSYLSAAVLWKRDHQYFLFIFSFLFIFIHYVTNYFFLNTYLLVVCDFFFTLFLFSYSIDLHTLVSIKMCLLFVNFLKLIFCFPFIHINNGTCLVALAYLFVL